MEERAKKIIEMCIKEKSRNPLEIFGNIVKQDFVRIHGPEHHVLDGAALLTAFYNAGGKIHLELSLNELMKRGLQMPGATCGMWGICGAVSSVGAALSIIDGTTPLSTDYSKLITEIPEVDVAISMGCNVGCPFIGRTFDDNWGLEDPTGKADEEFVLIIKEIENKILQLKRELV